MTTSFPVASLKGSPEERTDFDRLVKGPNAYRTISEVADELHVPQHVLRFWETRFPEVKPLKRGGGRRYYSPADIEILRHITDLLYVQGYTIKGVQRVLKEQLADADFVAAPPVIPEPAAPSGAPDEGGRSSFEIPVFQSSEPNRDHVAQPTGSDAEEDTRLVSRDEAGGLEEPETDTTRLSANVNHEISSEDAEAGADMQAAGPDSEVCVGSTHERDFDPVANDEPTILDPGEETSGLPVVMTPEDAAGAQASVSTQPSGSSETDSALVAILQDELAGLRIERGRWKQERRALRLALEDVLGELDNLREMLPST